MSDVAKPDPIAAGKFETPPQQVEMVEDINGLMIAWMRRRQEALATGVQALQQMAVSQDPGLAAKIYADWMGGSLNRILADINDAGTHAFRMVELAQGACQTVSGQAVTTLAAVGEQASVRTAPTGTPLREAA